MKKVCLQTILLIFILMMIACNSKTHHKQSSSDDTLNRSVKQSIENFKNQPVHQFLTAQLIDSTSDNKLLQLVFDNLSEKLPTDYRMEYPAVMSWNKSQQSIYMIWLLESEVNNGGFNQFYFNSSGQFYRLLPASLKLVGANRFADLTERANKVYESENEKIKKHQDGTLEGFSKSYENNPLNRFDDEFYKLGETENLDEIQIRYIRAHKSDFIDN